MAIISLISGRDNALDRKQADNANKYIDCRADREIWPFEDCMKSLESTIERAACDKTFTSADLL